MFFSEKNSANFKPITPASMNSVGSIHKKNWRLKISYYFLFKTALVTIINFYVRCEACNKLDTLVINRSLLAAEAGILLNTEPR